VPEETFLRGADRIQVAMESVRRMAESPPPAEAGADDGGGGGAGAAAPSSNSDNARPSLHALAGDTATQKLRIVTGGLARARQRTVLERWTNPKPQGRTRSPRYRVPSREEGNRRASRNAPVSDLPPEIPLTDDSRLFAPLCRGRARSRRHRGAARHRAGRGAREKRCAAGAAHAQVPGAPLTS
jgi:hypothetical protein